MAKKKPPIDPLNGPKMALAGDIVAMDDALNVTRNGRLYIEKGAIGRDQAGKRTGTYRFRKRGSVQYGWHNVSWAD
jgi:hypothetical protein